MRIAYKHLLKFIEEKPSIDDISDKFFQLGHEHEISDDIFEMEITPNRGDCLSIIGLLRELSIFYKVNLDFDIFSDNLSSLDINFKNKAISACPTISFLRIDIQGEIMPYKGLLKDYFNDLDINKNNFFTDISNYIAYETGQPTHCYDARKIIDSFSLEMIEGNYNFETLMDQEIKLKGKNLVFLQDNNVINLAGVMGGKNTSCTLHTKSVLIECAFFNPEEIIGKSIKYDIKSDAAYKFERGVDPLCHEKVLRRFIKIVGNHAELKNIQIFNEKYQDYEQIEIPFDLNVINKILGISLNKNEYKNFILKLGFKIHNGFILIPSYRNDISSQNDIAEEIARIIGYNNIDSIKLKIPSNGSQILSKTFDEFEIRSLLIKKGFFEVINYPFVNDSEKGSIKVDNPLDSNKQFLRTSLQKSLLMNLTYNEKRQKDSVKLFEISDVYNQEVNNEIIQKRMIGIICSGRIEKNYLNFSKKINIDYLEGILSSIETKSKPFIISRDGLDSKSKSEIVYWEFELTMSPIGLAKNKSLPVKKISDFNFKKYKEISEYPFSSRDLSYSVKDEKKYYELQELLINYENSLIKEIFIFDFFNNKKNNEVKIGFRFIFQSNSSTVTESQVNEVMKKIINDSLLIDSVEIPGLSK